MVTVLTVISRSSLILIAIAVSAAAAAVLFTFPSNPLIWQAATWTLLGALCGLLVLVLVSGYVLARDRSARTWQRTTSFLLGLVCLIAIAAISI